MGSPEGRGAAETLLFAGNVVDLGFLIGGIVTGNTLWAIWGIAGLAGGKWAESQVQAARKKGVWIP